MFNCKIIVMTLSFIYKKYNLYYKMITVRITHKQRIKNIFNYKIVVMILSFIYEII